MVKLAVDAYYTGNKAKVIGVLFENFSDEKPLEIISKIVDDVAPPYESRSFYKKGAAVHRLAFAGFGRAGYLAHRDRRFRLS